ncbi:exodeoxyribonuclease VII small subunit [uncultured Pseudodesulfovibrio sp.]|uniref:exodeoxyribonuclease VII small subunit n=1 Tax=uncultured Pseudodesulfovibrio sp. TaxID=2035858 RepID=UPI0029C8EAA0|nr:exodeoxyribonuclease VII small subunit [uncultured Pseudodesulfovibrio sp.]
MGKETFEDRLERLKSIVERLERGELPLEEGVTLYKEGVKLVQTCGKQLDSARHEVKIVSEGLVREFEHLESLGAEDSNDG